MVKRWQERELIAALAARRGVHLTGARQCGKTTLAETVEIPVCLRYTFDDDALRATAEGDPNGFVNLGMCYLRGFGCQQDRDLAFACFKAAADAADLVIVFTGTELGYQENMESESRDRKSMDLPPALEQAMHTILGWNHSRLVVVSRTGTPVGYTWTDKAKTLVQTSYLGMEEGNAIVDVLTGEVNPSGRLCQSWPKRYADTAVAQCGTYNATNVTYNERFYIGYRWHDHRGIEPLFPFGFGKSYTTFRYSDVSATNLQVSVTVTNAGMVKGKEVVQFYVAYPDAKVERCVKELKGFAKTKLLAPGESETVKIFVSKRDLAYWDDFASRFTTDAGAYELLVGASSVDIRSRQRITVAETVRYRD